MKRKPMLFEKITGMHKCVGREVIGLIGTHHGAGVTHTGLMLAFYMGTELGKKTAFLECNTHLDMQYLQKAYDWSIETKDSFSFHLTSFYKEVSEGKVAGILGEDFECIIMDFGIDFHSNRDEFLRCSTKIVIGGDSEWDIPKLLQFSDMTKEIRGSGTWLYFIPQANNKTITRLRNEATLRVWAVPVNDDPIVPSQDTNRFFRRLF